MKMNRTDHALFKSGTPAEELKHQGKDFISTAYDGKTVEVKSVGSGTFFDGL